MLKTKLTEEMKTAMKARDSVRLGMIRMMLAAIKNVEIDNGEQTDDQIIGILKSERKKMRDAVDQFQSAGRTDLVEEESKKLIILDEFLPEEMSREQVESIVDEIISQSEGENFGQVMGKVMAKLKGQADGKLVGEVVKAKLQN